MFVGIACVCSEFDVVTLVNWRLLQDRMTYGGTTVGIATNCSLLAQKQS